MSIRRVLYVLASVLLASVLFLQPAGAQTRFTYSKGQTVSPAYEGWMPNDDGSFTLYFGYMNTNWLEEFDVPIGPQNALEPGGPDQGQPTHFYPRRNPFLFTIQVPKDFGSKELIWTLTTNGKTEKVYASLKGDYQIDKQVMSLEVGGDFGSQNEALRTNIPPELEVQGEMRRMAKVGEALTLVALAGDPDNLPARRDRKLQPRYPGKAAVEESVKLPPRPAGAPDENAANDIYKIPSSPNPMSGAGLRLSWIVYRGKASAVTFSPDQFKTWTDTRAWSNSPWSPPFVIPEPPPEGRWVTAVTFREPGEYVLRTVVSDGSLFTYENITVFVTP
jgi:hypothetical protein